MYTLRPPDAPELRPETLEKSRGIGNTDILLITLMWPMSEHRLQTMESVGAAESEMFFSSV